MSNTPVKLGIVGLGRWAKVLTRAARQSRELFFLEYLADVTHPARGVHPSAV